MTNKETQWTALDRQVRHLSFAFISVIRDSSFFSTFPVLRKP